jgi:hypothetical protein
MVSREAVGWRGRNAIHPFFFGMCAHSSIILGRREYLFMRNYYFDNLFIRFSILLPMDQ